MSFEINERDSYASIEVLRDGLTKNETLMNLSLSNCNVTDTGARELGKLLRSNSKLHHLWLLFNKGIGDAGARGLAAALSEGSDPNTTLDRIWMGGNSISYACQAECFEKTNGRMHFIPDEHLGL